MGLGLCSWSGVNKGVRKAGNTLSGRDSRRFQGTRRGLPSAP